MDRPPHMFSNKADRPGVWAGAAAGITKTKPSKTLFVSGATSVQSQSLFPPLSGFVAARPVRQNLFVDFVSEGAAAAAMRQLQGASGLVIDFDKDASTSKRKHLAALNAEDRRAKEEREAVLRTMQIYCCPLCSNPLLYLSNTAPALKDVPQRSTDGAHALPETFIREMSFAGLPPRTIQRPKGVETQYSLACPSCDIPCAYRPVSIEAPSKFLYVLPGSLVVRPYSSSATARGATGAVDTRAENTSPGGCATGGGCGGVEGVAVAVATSAPLSLDSPAAESEAVTEEGGGPPSKLRRTER